MSNRKDGRQQTAAEGEQALKANVGGDAIVSHRYTTTEKLANFIPCLRQKFAPKRNLIAGPFAGEFGYELMQWQGFVRARRPHYERVHVLTYPGRDYLYEECEVHYHKLDLKTAGYGYGRTDPATAQRMATDLARRIALEDYDQFDPRLLCTQYHRRMWGQQFRLLEETPAEKSCDVLFHFRAVRKEGYDHQKNYSPDLADVLVARCRDHGLTNGCIGHPDYSYCPPGSDDLRTIDLKETVAAISAARAVAGENSGPMHLANLCGKPTIVWAQDQWRIDFSLRWNPFRVPIYIAANDSAQPPPEIVCDAIMRGLDDMAKRSYNFTKPLYTWPAQPIAFY
ncbi:MAG TPA: hypothetical protein VGG02_03010 [Chthoniobacterales bacterium]|jgi:hypothetical protein